MFNPKDKKFIVSEMLSFSEPKNKHYSMNEDWTLGASKIGLGNTDQNTHYWKGEVINGYITLRREDLTELHNILYVGSVSELSFTFDQNMHPVIVYVKNNKSFMYRYDGKDFNLIRLEDKFNHPRVELDHKLIAHSPISDIVLGYTYKGKLCYALQRDKYQKEYVIDVNLSLIHI